MGLFSLFVRGEALMQKFPRHRRREANTTSYVSDYLTRSVRRAIGFVLVAKSETTPAPNAPSRWETRSKWRRPRKYAPMSATGEFDTG